MQHPHGRSTKKYTWHWMVLPRLQPFSPPNWGMTTDLSSLHSNFHVLVVFCFNVSFPHIFSVLHPNSIETSRFSLSIHENQLTEEKYMQSSIVTCRSMLPPPVSAQSAFALSKKLILHYVYIIIGKPFKTIMYFMCWHLQASKVPRAVGNFFPSHIIDMNHKIVNSFNWNHV